MAKSVLDISPRSLRSQSSRRSLGDKRETDYKMKDNKLLFTQGFIERITTPKTRCRYYDTKVLGLMLESMPTGAKIFRFRKKVNNKAQWATIGHFPKVPLEAARDEAIRLSSQLTTGADFTGLRQTHKDEPNLRELANFYFEQYANDRCQTAGEMKKDFTRWYAAELDLRISKINTYTVQATWFIDKDKNGESRYVALSDAALAILKRRYKNRGLLPWVLPGGRSIRRPTSNHLAEPKKHGLLSVIMQGYLI